MTVAASWRHLSARTALLLALALALAFAGCRAPQRGTANAPAAPSATLPATRFSPTATDLGGSSADVPCHLIGGNPIVDVTVNGHGPLRMVIDTGSSTVVLAPEVARRVGARPTGSAVSVNGVQAGQVCRVDEVRVGSAAFRGLDASVLDLEVMRSVLGPVDGVLGLPLFSDCLVTFDFPARRVVLGDGRLPPADGRDVLPLRVIEGQVVAVDVDLAGTVRPLTIDTANDAAVVLSPALTGDVPLEAVATLPTRLATVTGTTPLRVARLRGPAGVGRHVLDRPVVTLIPPDAAGRNRALLGAGVLRQFVLTLDLRSMVARFDRAEDTPIASQPVRGPGFRYRREAGALVVTGPAAGSSLDAVGLRPGDRVTAVNGRPVAGLAGGEVNDLAAGPAAWTVDVERAEGPVTVTVPLQELVP